MADYIVRFVATLDPNGDGALYWPQYDSDQRQVLTFLDGDPALNISTDKERMAGTRLLTRLSLADPI